MSGPGGPHWRTVERREEFEAAHPAARIWQVPLFGFPVGWMGSVPVGGVVTETGPHGELSALLDVMDALAERAAALERGGKLG